MRTPGPQRVLLVGDSITGNYAAVAAPALRLHGYQVTVAALGGTGLLDSDKCHGRYAKRLLKTVEPDIVVYQNKGNYNLLANFGVPPCKPLLQYASTAFYRRWARAAKQSQKILSKNGARFIWVLNPSVGLNIDPSGGIVPRLNQIYSTLAPSGGFVDGLDPFSDATYDPSLITPMGFTSAPADQVLANLVAVAKIG